MTLKQFLQSETTKLFAQDTKVQFMNTKDGCHSYKSDFDNRIDLGNALTSFNENTLNREVSCIDVTRVNFTFGAIIVYFKD